MDKTDLQKQFEGKTLSEKMKNYIYKTRSYCLYQRVVVIQLEMNKKEANTRTSRKMEQ